MLLRGKVREGRYICDMVFHYFAKAELSINNVVPQICTTMGMTVNAC